MSPPAAFTRATVGGATSICQHKPAAFRRRIFPGGVFNLYGQLAASVDQRNFGIQYG